jgi:cbb3-type cytochrome oxidase subunit 3
MVLNFLLFIAVVLIIFNSKRKTNQARNSTR